MIKESFPILNKKYFLIQKLGEGATSCVFLGAPVDKQDQQVAIKVITYPKLKADAFEQEINILSKIHHENVIGLIDYGVGAIEKNQQISDNKQYLVLEYASRGILFNFIRDTNKPFGEDFGRYLFFEMLKGVQAIHCSGFAHRDLKIENIMIDGNYNVKIGDFGSASALDRKHGTGKLTSQVGTLKYCAPEILRKRPYVGTQVDIFSLGICLFIIVFGKYPFGAATKYDPGYKLIMQKQFKQYWDNDQRSQQFKASEEFKDLFNQLVFYDSSFRPSIAKIIEHPFMKKTMPSKEQFYKELCEREQIIYQKQQIFLLRDKQIQQLSVAQSSQVFRELREDEKTFTSQSIVPKYKKQTVVNHSYSIRIKGVVPYIFMNSFAKALEQSSKFEKEIIYDLKKLKIAVKTQGFDKCEEEPEQEEDDDSEDDFDLINNELKVSITMKYDEDNDWYIIELKKKQGTYEDYYKLYKESENIVKGFADKFTA